MTTHLKAHEKLPAQIMLPIVTDYKRSGPEGNVVKRKEKKDLRAIFEMGLSERDSYTAIPVGDRSE